MRAPERTVGERLDPLARIIFPIAQLFQHDLALGLDVVALKAWPLRDACDERERIVELAGRDRPCDRNRLFSGRRIETIAAALHRLGEFGARVVVRCLEDEVLEEM